MSGLEAAEHLRLVTVGITFGEDRTVAFTRYLALPTRSKPHLGREPMHDQSQWQQNLTTTSG